MSAPAWVEDPDRPVSLLSLDVRSAEGGSTGRLRREDPYLVELELAVRRWAVEALEHR